MKDPRRHSEAHLAFIRTLPCLVTGREPSAERIEAAHVRYASLMHGKRETGKAEKPHDCWTVPLTARAHRHQHGMDEEAFWRGHNIDPLTVAALLWLHSGNENAARQVIHHAITGNFRIEE